jgi:hypothetical protein
MKIFKKIRQFVCCHDWLYDSVDNEFHCEKCYKLLTIFSNPSNKQERELLTLFFLRNIYHQLAGADGIGRKFFNKINLDN